VTAPSEIETSQPFQQRLLEGDSKIAHLRREQLKLLFEHERAQAIPTSARFLFYELVRRGIVSKERKVGGVLIRMQARR